jgi:diguanylate cyclase
VLDRELKKVRRESERDGLTGAFNRKAFDQRLLQLVEKNTAMKAAFSLIMLDVDDFKKINDTFGHLTGDRALVALVNQCRHFIRSEDILARYGGEEFVIILPGASLRNAVKRANQIRQAVASTRYAVDDRLDRQTLSMTISLGVAAHRKADTVATLVERADRALLCAKCDGKNRVVSEKQVSDNA